MTEMTIRVIEHHQKPMTFSNGKPGRDAAALEVGIIERGTKGGQTVIALCMRTPEGENILFEITGNLFEGLIGAYRGANMRFQDKIKSN